MAASVRKSGRRVDIAGAPSHNGPPALLHCRDIRTGSATTRRRHMLMRLGSVVAAAIVAAACSGSGSVNLGEVNTKPAYVRGTISSTTYDGTTDDLLTAGLGKSGLGSATAPAVATPTSPTVAEIRRIAIYNNYRALVDPSANGGFGT